MGKYSVTYNQKESSVKKSKQPHYIWRGLGCLIMIILPVISFAASSLIVDYLSSPEIKLVPRQLLGKPRLPDFVYRSDGLTTILKPLTEIEDLYAILAVGILFMILLSGLISVIYAAVYSAVGPSRYGPTDAPPPRIKITKKSR